ncbi:MAG: amidohydrolase family protein [Bacillota bacterium]
MLKIANARVYDPKNNLLGESADLYAQGGKISPPGEADETYDAGGGIVMAGAIDIHSHIAGYPLNLVRGGELSALAPCVSDTGFEYARMGYTAVVNPALPALSAKQAFLEENAIPNLDKLNLVWIGENPAFLNIASEGGREELEHYLSWLIEVSGGYGFKVINPRGGDAGGPLGYAALLGRLLECNERLKLPHALHLHHPYLGGMDAYRAVCETIRRADGLRLHLAHLQFYGYKTGRDGRMLSAAEELARAINSSESVTFDAGQVVFGDAAAVTADIGFARKLAGEKRNGGFMQQLWEEDGGFGVLGLSYSRDNYVGSMQWLVGLELMLLTEDPGKVFLSTDHPNGGPFTAYPTLIRLLMDKAFRDEQVKLLHPRAQANTCLGDISREYTLAEIAALTRSGPARCLGLDFKGHLGVGADADIVVYREQRDFAEMFARPAAVFKSGVNIAKTPPPTSILMAKPPQYDRDFVRGRVGKHLSVGFSEAFMSGEFLLQNGAAYFEGRR